MALIKPQPATIRTGMRLLMVPWFLVCAISAETGTPVIEGTPLIDAVKKGDMPAVRTLLKQKKDRINERLGTGETALHWAAYQDNVEAAELLLRAGANVNATSELGVTPLWVVSANGSSTMVATLLKAGALPGLAPPTGGTPLMRAVRTGPFENIVALLAAGADPNAKEGARDQTALMWAAAQRRPDIVKALLAAGADIHARSKAWQGHVAICCPAFNGDNAVKTVDAAEGGLTPLLFAARAGDPESVRLLLDAGANPNEVEPAGESALLVAAHYGHGDAGKVLLEKGADPNATGVGYTALHAAVLRGNVSLVNALLASGANPNARLTEGSPSRRVARDYAFNRLWIGATPFWLAAGLHEVDIMRVLAAQGADPRLPRNDGGTPLIAAARGENARTLSELGGNGTVPAVPPERERRALEAVKVAVALGADVIAVDDAGDTALHRAAYRKVPSVVQFLADKGADLNLKNKNGETPLTLALSWGVVQKGGVTLSDTHVLPDGGRTADSLRKLGARE